MNIEQTVESLKSRGITAHDLEDTIQALVHDRMLNTTMLTLGSESALNALARQVAEKVDSLTEEGLEAQVRYMASYYNNPDHLEWALSGYLTLPLAA